MRSRLWLNVPVAFGCLLACCWFLSTNTDMPHVKAAAPTPDSKCKELADSVSQLRARVDQLEKELAAIKRNALFSGLTPGRAEATHPSEEELDALRELAETHLMNWQRAHALAIAGAKGGEAEKEACARFHCLQSFARLAWAERQDKIALERLTQTVLAAGHMVEATQAAFQTDTVTFDALAAAVGARAEASLTLFRAGGALPGKKVKRSVPWQVPYRNVPWTAPLPGTPEFQRLPERSQPYERPQSPPPLLTPAPKAP